MKKITAFLGFVGVVSAFYGCSSDNSSSATNDKENSAAVSSSSGNVSVSSSGGSSVNSSGTTTISSSTVQQHQSNIIRDTIHVTVTVPAGEAGTYEDPYFSSGIFCWSAECEAQWASSSSVVQQVSSSSYSIEVTMSSEAPVLPLVTETQMIDQRDQHSYTLQRVAGLLWMSQNLNYETKSGSFCKTASSDDMCATYGRYYIYNSAVKACPTGWRLPTQAEVEALDAAVEHEWWAIGGRFKVSDDAATDFGLDEEQGYIWIQATGEYSSFRVKNYDGDTPHEFQAGSTSERAYNVRCVTDQY